MGTTLKTDTSGSGSHVSGSDRTQPRREGATRGADQASRTFAAGVQRKVSAYCTPAQVPLVVSGTGVGADPCANHDFFELRARLFRTPPFKEMSKISIT